MVKLPELTVTESKMGGERVLKSVLASLKQSDFDGLVVTELEKDGEKKTGAIALQDGKPVAALYESMVSEDFRKSIEGPEALKHIWEDADDSECEIKVGSVKNLEEFLGENAGAVLYRGKDGAPTISEKKGAQKKSSRRVGLVWGGTSQRKSDEVQSLAKKRKRWKDEGFNVTKLDDALKEEDDDAAGRIFKDFTEQVRVLRELKEELEGLDIRGFDEEIDSLRAIIKDPDRIPEIERGIADLKEVETSWKEETMDELEGELEKVKEDKERQERVKGVYDLILKHETSKSKAPVISKSEEDEGDKEEVEKESPPDSENDEEVNDGVEKRFQFDGFIVGPNSQFAHAAAISVSKEPGKGYNPLFIWSGPGLGKTHLLHAIANTIKESYPDMDIKYISAEEFTNEMIEAVQKNGLLQFREKYRNLDVLILDDVQFLAGKEETQEEFFHTFNALFTDGKHVILASDRPPKEIPTLKNRLISRFEGGLITDIQPAGTETRVAILRKKAEEQSLEIADDVLNFIASKEKENIRELEGGLNRVVAFSSLMKREITLELAKEVLKDGEDDKDDNGDVELAPVKESGEGQESAQKKPAEISIDEFIGGESYLIEEDRPEKSIVLLKTLREKGFETMYVTRSNPKRAKQKYGLDDVEILWLTDKDSSVVKTVQPSLERLIYLVETFLSKGKGVVLLDGLEYLVSNNNFDAVLRFIRKLVDDFSETESHFLLSLSPDTVKKQELSILEREMEVLG